MAALWKESDARAVGGTGEKLLRKKSPFPQFLGQRQDVATLTGSVALRFNAFLQRK